LPVTFHTLQRTAQFRQPLLDHLPQLRLAARTTPRWPLARDQHSLPAGGRGVPRAAQRQDIPRIKVALALRGVIAPYVRPPLRPLDQTQMADLRSALPVTESTSHGP